MMNAFASKHATLLWLTFTLLTYLAASRLYQRSGRNPWLIPVIPGVSLIVLVLIASDTPYPVYFESTRFIHFFVGPVIVGLAIPLFHQIQRLKKIWLPISVALFAGSSAAILSGWLIAWVFGGSAVTLISLSGKSATMPIAMALAGQFDGLVPIAAMSVALTGIAGIIMARPLLNLLGIRDPAVRGFSLGLTAHALGTARALQHDETAGAYAALGMALNGLATALLVPALIYLSRYLGFFA